ncbi:MAG: hypothetical protein AAGF86_19785 [Pseudomonadota bacterium]
MTLGYGALGLAMLNDPRGAVLAKRVLGASPSGSAERVRAYRLGQRAAVLGLLMSSGAGDAHAVWLSEHVPSDPYVGLTAMRMLRLMGRPVALAERLSVELERDAEPIGSSR